MVIQIGIAKDCRFNTEESRETVEIIERPAGGESVVFCSGIRGGENNKTISSMIVNRIVGKITESSRDSTALRIVSDQMCHEYGGDACGDLCMFSADFESQTLVISRCTSLPVYYYQRGQLNIWDSEQKRIGSDKSVHPSITEIPLEEETMLIFLSRGVQSAGLTYGEESAVLETLRSMAEEDSGRSAENLADSLLRLAQGLDRDRPQEDMTVLVMKIDKKTGKESHRLSLTVPVPGNSRDFDWQERIPTFSVFFD